MAENDWGDERPPMTPEEKAAFDATLPVAMITKKGQFLHHPDGTKEKIGPDHPCFNHSIGY